MARRDAGRSRWSRPDSERPTGPYIRGSVVCEPIPDPTVFKVFVDFRPRAPRDRFGDVRIRHGKEGPDTRVDDREERHHLCGCVEADSSGRQLNLAFAEHGFVRVVVCTRKKSTKLGYEISLCPKIVIIFYTYIVPYLMLLKSETTHLRLMHLETVGTPLARDRENTLDDWGRLGTSVRCLCATSEGRSLKTVPNNTPLSFSYGVGSRRVPSRHVSLLCFI